MVITSLLLEHEAFSTTRACRFRLESSRAPWRCSLSEPVKNPCPPSSPKAPTVSLSHWQFDGRTLTPHHAFIRDARRERSRRWGRRRWMAQYRRQHGQWPWGPACDRCHPRWVDRARARFVANNAPKSPDIITGNRRSIRTGSTGTSSTAEVRRRTHSSGLVLGRVRGSKVLSREDVEQEALEPWRLLSRRRKQRAAGWVLHPGEVALDRLSERRCGRPERPRRCALRIPAPVKRRGCASVAVQLDDCCPDGPSSP